MELNTANDQLFVKRLTEITEARLSDENFGVSELVDEMKMSRASVHRRLKQATRKSIPQFIMEIRLGKAFGMLQLKEGTVAEIAYAVGFGSATYFNKCFHNHYGISPGEVMKGNHHEKIPTQQPKTRNKIKNYLVLSVVSVFLVAVAVFFFFKNNNEKHTAKTIAVLPPVDNSPDNSKSYILEGFKEEVQVKLNAIKDLKITSSTTTEHYRNSNQTLNEIVKKLKVNYVIEISGQTIENKTSIRVQLIEAATDKNIWSKTYEREINQENIFEIQQEVALTVAQKVNATITTDEKQMIGKRPTENMAAYKYYLQGINYLSLYDRGRNSSHWKLAKAEFENALKLDSTFGNAWLGLAQIYISNLPYETKGPIYEYFKTINNIRDTASMFLNNAFKYGVSDYNELMLRKSSYLQLTGEFDKSLQLKEEIWKNREKDFRYFYEVGNHYHWKRDYYNHIKYSLTSLDITPETEIPKMDMMFKLVNSFNKTGFPKTAGKYAYEIYKINNDSNQYKSLLMGITFDSGNYEVYKNEIERLFTANPSNISNALNLMFAQLILNDEAGALETFSKTMNHFNKPTGSISIKNNLMISYLYSLKGMKNEAQPFINEVLNTEKVVVELYIEHLHLHTIYFYLAAAFAFNGQDKKALDLLNRIAKRETVPLFVIQYTRTLPYFENLREKPEFKKIVGEMETKYQDQHEKVKKLLISLGMEPE
jgi:TolB-like protein/AraC-like DNA-binding protein